MKAFCRPVTLLLFLMLLIPSCEDRVWDNPGDSQGDLRPGEWAPGNLQAEVLNDSQIRLSWEQGNKMIEGFQIERSVTSLPTWDVIGKTAKDLMQYIDSGLNTEIVYTYRVCAYAADNQSDYVVSNQTSTNFPSPTNLAATPLNDSEIQLSWVDNCSFEEGFRIERKVAGESWILVASVGLNAVSYTDTYLDYGPVYTYRICAYTQENQSGYVTSSSLSTVFPPPTNLVATPLNDSEIQLSWVDNCGFEDGFRIERQQNWGVWEQVAEVGMDVIQYIDSGLSPGHIFKYRICAFTINNQSDYVFTNNLVIDVDGNIYNTVKIGNQVWMQENLKVMHYRNGDTIPNSIDSSEWVGLTTGAWCAYDNDEGHIATYGRLYNWYAVNDRRNIAPEGWHVPSDTNWQTLVDYLGGDGVAGGHMKETGTTHWNSPNTGATNASGFNALPGGYRGSYGYFSYLGHNAFFWSGTEYGNSAWYRRLSTDYSDVYSGYGNKQYGFSVRCVRD